MTTTNIEWCDRVWNPVTGCTKVSPGCKHCYAEGVADRFWATQYPPVDIETNGPAGTVTRPREFTDVMEHANKLTEPLRWRKPWRVFVNSMSDLFHEAVSDEFIDRVFAVMTLCQRHTFIVLTKRPERMRRYMAHDIRRDAILTPMLQFAGEVDGRPEGGLLQHAFIVEELWKSGRGWPLPNVIVGVSSEDQQRADERIPLLLQTPAAIRCVSLEPLLGPIDLTSIAWAEGAWNHRVDVLRRGYWNAEGWLGLGPAAPLGQPRGGFTNHSDMNGVDWVIVGGESGPKARPCDVAWIRAIVQQCQEVGTPVFVKQMGSVVRVGRDECLQFAMQGSWSADGPGAPYGTAKPWDRKGGDPIEWPPDLRVRECPEHRKE